jgi:hypothetical protein
MLFSVGDSGAVLLAGADVVVVVVVSVVDGASFSAPPHAAVSAPMATIADPPTTAATRRLKRREFMCKSYLLTPTRRVRPTAGAVILTVTAPTVHKKRQ